MYEILYEIKINENNRPYIDLPEDYEDKMEDKFFVMELVYYILKDTLKRRNSELDSNTNKLINSVISLLTQISDEMAFLVYKKMKNAGDLNFFMNNNYHIMVPTIEMRNKLPLNNITYENKLFDRREGLKVFVVEDLNIYILENGIKNENWKFLK